jgi:hypothetical protein
MSEKRNGDTVPHELIRSGCGDVHPEVPASVEDVPGTARDEEVRVAVDSHIQVVLLLGKYGYFGPVFKELSHPSLVHCVMFCPGCSVPDSQLSSS